MYIPIIHHPGLAAYTYRELFSKCRKEGISFDMERKNGSLILLCDEVNSGIISLMTISIHHLIDLRGNSTQDS